jgi:hypothetical protein
LEKFSPNISASPAIAKSISSTSFGTGATGLLVAAVPSGVRRYELKSPALEPDDDSALSRKSPGSGH